MPAKLGFLGGGINSAVGYAHFVASQLDQRFKLIAGAFSRDDEINQSSGLGYGLDASHIFSDLASLLDTVGDEIDALVILTPTPDHPEAVRKALDIGVNVICEKALATSGADARELAQYAEESSGKCLVTFNYTGYPAIREMRQRIASGQIGQLIQLNIEMPQESFLREGAVAQDWRTRDYAVPTVSLDLGVHVLHLAEFIAQPGPVASVHASELHRGAISEVIDNVNCLVGYENGMVANYWWSKAALGYRNGLRVRVFGTDGSMEWCQMHPEEITLCDRSGRREIVDRGCCDQESQLAQPFYNRFKAGHPSGFIEAFGNLYGDFYRLLTESEQHRELHAIYGAGAAADGLELIERIHGAAATPIDPEH